MLKEWEEVRQRPEEGSRRWFKDDSFDLIVWFKDGEVEGFQLCYDTNASQRAITWYATGSYVHAKVDDGEQRFGSKETPILVSDGVFDAVTVADQFREAAAQIDQEIATLVYNKLVSYSE